MNIRTRIRRWWIGADLYDRARLTVVILDDCDAEGRRRAEATIARIKAEERA